MARKRRFRFGLPIVFAIAIISRLRGHISRLWRFVGTKYAPSGNRI